MTRVDFYVLADESPEARFRFACRLAEKAVEQGHRVHMQTASSADTQRLDDLLWTFNDRAFLPHEVLNGGAPSHARVMITLGEGPVATEYRQLLINLADTLPTEFDSYQRVAEIVDSDPERKRVARERYKQYRERGCSLESHNL